MSRFTLLLGGPVSVTERLRRQIADSRVIAADSGMRHAGPMDLDVELWLGDFDSSSDELRSQHAHIPSQSFPVAKDSTDGELAMDVALERGATELVLIGALGGDRSDHALCHLMAALDLAARGIPVLATNGTEEAYPLLPGNLDLDLPHGSGFSVLAFDQLTGLSMRGLEWPLDDHTVEPGSSLTLSNQVTGPVKINLKSGRAIIFAQPGGFTL
ncbi:MAG: thiamine diphosphokinase [Rhodospirillales bacterium]|nr:thiamine diphosphokinase [Rhodospirillales bacterium]